MTTLQNNLVNYRVPSKAKKAVTSAKKAAKSGKKGAYQKSVEKTYFPNSGHVSPLRAFTMMRRDEKKKARRGHAKSKDNKRNLNLSGTFDSANKSDRVAVYIDTGGSNML